jgi:hypothetical protein
LAKQNFVELRAGSGTLRVIARKRIERMLYHLFPQWWLPLNIMISHRLISYQAAVTRYETQQRWARYGGIELLIWLVMGWLASQRTVKKVGQMWHKAGKAGPDQVTNKSSGHFTGAHLPR